MIQPFLEEKIRNSWVDPIKAESDEKLLYQYKLAWAWAKAAKELIDFMNEKIETAEQLTLKEKGEYVDKLREALN